MSWIISWYTFLSPLRVIIFLIMVDNNVLLIVLSLVCIKSYIVGFDTALVDVQYLFVLFFIHPFFSCNRGSLVWLLIYFDLCSVCLPSFSSILAAVSVRVLMMLCYHFLILFYFVSKSGNIRVIFTFAFWNFFLYMVSKVFKDCYKSNF